MKHRLAIVIASAAFAVTGVTGAAVAHADDPTGDLEAPEANVTASSYWACVAIDHVHIGACLENPLPDLSNWGTLQGQVEDRTGVGAP